MKIYWWGSAYVILLKCENERDMPNGTDIIKLKKLHKTDFDFTAMIRCSEWCMMLPGGRTCVT
jgi:hypothetical protein